MTADTTTSPEQWTIRRVLDWTKDYLAKQGCPSPRLDAEILLAHARRCPRIQLYTQFNEVLSEEVRGRMRELVKRRANHEPVAYLVGYREFFSLDFEVTRDVLIPRPETELLVMETLEAIQDRDQPKVLDLGTGSGCIAVAVAVNAPTASVTSVELSEPALEVAQRNAARHEVADRIILLPGNLFDPVSETVRFDVIVSNPPYVAAHEKESLEPDVRLHEPASALFAGADGLDVIRRIAEDAPRFLMPGGTLLIEFSPEQADAIADLLNGNAALRDVTILRDMGHNARAVRAIKRDDGG